MSGLIAAAFAAGMVATVNPCGFAMMPAYLGFILDDRGSSRRSALTVGIAVSVGFVAIFMFSGVLIASGLRAIVNWIPWMTLPVGAGLIAAGLATLRGQHLFTRRPGVKRTTRDRSLKGLVGFGASYGIASLSCTLPILLNIAAGTVATATLAESLLIFTAHGLGMSLVVIVLTLVVAAGRDRLVAKIRPLSARLDTVSGWVMVVAGVFILWYWITVLAGGASDLGSNPVVRVIEEFTADVTNFVADRPVIVGFGALVLGLAVWFAGWRMHQPGDEATDEKTNLRTSGRT